MSNLAQSAKVSVLAHGERMEAIEAFKQLPGEVEFIIYPTLAFDIGERDLVWEMTRDWKQITIPPKTIVFIDPPSKLDPTRQKLRAQPNRNVYFTKGVTATWKKWAEVNGATTSEFGIDKAKLIQLLRAGNKEAGIPKFTVSAAEHFAACNPGGLASLSNGLQPLIEAEFKEPINLENVLRVWPFSVSKEKVYAVSLTAFRKALGTKDAIALALRVPEGETISSLHGLKLACKSSTNRVNLIDSMLLGMYQKLWSPQAALILFTLACFEEAQWPSPSRSSPRELSDYALTQLKAFSQHSNTPFWLT